MNLVCCRNSPPCKFMDHKFIVPSRSLAKYNRSFHGIGARLVPRYSAVKATASVAFGANFQSFSTKPPV